MRLFSRLLIFIALFASFGSQSNAAPWSIEENRMHSATAVQAVSVDRTRASRASDYHAPGFDALLTTHALLSRPDSSRFAAQIREHVTLRRNLVVFLARAPPSPLV